MSLVKSLWQPARGHAARMLAFASTQLRTHPPLLKLLQPSQRWQRLPVLDGRLVDVLSAKGEEVAADKVRGAVADDSDLHERGEAGNHSGTRRRQP